MDGLILSILLAAMPAPAQGLRNEIGKRNELGVGFGLARFDSDRDNQTPGNQKMQGSVWAARKLHRNYSYGVLADFSLILCPVCDDSPDDDLKAIAVIGSARKDFLPFSFLVGAGIGAAKVKDGVFVGDRETTEEFLTTDFPVLARASVGREFQGLGIGIGIEFKYHLNSENNAFLATVPLILSF